MRYKLAYETCVKNPENDFLVPIIFVCDETKVSNQDKASCWPLLFTTSILNQEMKTCFSDGYHLAAGLGDVPVTAGLQQNRIHEAPAQGHHSDCRVGLFRTSCAVFLPDVISWRTDHHFLPHWHDLFLSHTSPYFKSSPQFRGPQCTSLLAFKVKKPMALKIFNSILLLFFLTVFKQVGQ